MRPALREKGDDLGALNLISGAPHGFTEDAPLVATLFASYATVAVVGAEKDEQRRDALGRRDVIGQATGIVMERFSLIGPAPSAS